MTKIYDKKTSHEVVFQAIQLGTCRKTAVDTLFHIYRSHRVMQYDLVLLDIKKMAKFNWKQCRNATVEGCNGEKDP